MQTGQFLLFLILPVVSETCCVGTYQMKVPVAAAGHLHYRAVEGENFMMPCIQSTQNNLWFRTGGHGPVEDNTSFGCGEVFTADVKHSGQYVCVKSGSKLFLHLQVVERSSLRCFQPEEGSVELLNNVGGSILCPGHNCSDNRDVTWYKGNVSVSELRRDFCVKDGQLLLCEVKGKYDNGLYFCDRRVEEEGITWTFRRAVKVTVVAHITASHPPRMVYPFANMTEKVEMGQPHNLTCEVFFPYEKNLKANVQWFVNYGGNKELMTSLEMSGSQLRSDILEEYRIIQRGIIQEVTPQHLNHTYTCFANNTAGNVSVTVGLEEKVKWPSLVVYPVSSVLLVVVVGVIVYLMRLELQIIYRSHFHCGRHDEDEKMFDVFLSYVWSPEKEAANFYINTEEEEEEEENTEEEEEEDEVSQRSLSLLLHQVLEGEWGYRLCLPERDIIPGGAYTKDIVLALQKSQMLICLLSAHYFCSSNAVFVLESGIQALLKNSGLKLLLIRTRRDSASMFQEAQLPSLVQRSLKVLPSLMWTGDQPDRVSCNFWRSLRKNMPKYQVKMK
ncbi:interleukin-18 receptor accessory protein-like [Cynoglossus semilaevis]|uniref:interleukin-18 receptor accessory protein-like n=1 Tax=Cynoglossus semilaevis TaxID=244447 RepID=UPI0007DCB0C4|nr:interleukin-18 receptor accessory protein-like [Cynoglossus semilaevis]